MAAVIQSNHDQIQQNLSHRTLLCPTVKRDGQLYLRVSVRRSLHGPVRVPLSLRIRLSVPAALPVPAPSAMSAALVSVRARRLLHQHLIRPLARHLTNHMQHRAVNHLHIYILQLTDKITEKNSPGEKRNHVFWQVDFTNILILLLNMTFYDDGDYY